jgi:hypothetical protein
MGWTNSLFAEQAPQHTVPVTDLGPHVDGGANSAGQSSAANDQQAFMVACGIVIGALLLLWFMGGIAFRSARL